MHITCNILSVISSKGGVELNSRDMLGLDMDRELQLKAGGTVFVSNCLFRQAVKLKDELCVDFLWECPPVTKSKQQQGLGFP